MYSLCKTGTCLQYKVADNFFIICFRLFLEELNVFYKSSLGLLNIKGYIGMADRKGW